MEDGKRKKKNKKNKGKAAKAVGNVSVGSGESIQTGLELNQESASEQNHLEPNAGIVGAQTGGELTTMVDNGTLSSEEPIQTGSEVNHESDPEQNHREPDTGILGADNVSATDSEGEPERRKVKESNLVDLQEAIKNIQNNIISCIEKEASLEKKVEILQNENEFFVKTQQINWNLKFEQLQTEMHSCSVKGASLENKLSSMESENDHRIQKENLISEMVAILEEANTGLRMQVKELARSRDNLVQENQQLTNSISLLEARVQHLENEAASFRLSTRMMTKISADKDPEKQVEPVSEPSEKLVTVEPELVGKVNQQNGIVEHSATFSAPSLEADASAVPATYLLPHEEIISESTDKFASSGAFFETISITDANVNGIADVRVHLKELPLLDELNGSAEIVQIPLDDNQLQQVEAHDIKNDEKVVPFSDAPLIGAPFRLMSFVAKYVSGADLVKENRHNSGR